VEDLAEKNQRMVNNLTALQEISQVMLTTVQEDRLLEILLQGLTLEQGLGFDRAVVLQVDEAAQTLKGAKGARRPARPIEAPNDKALLLPPPAELPVAEWEIPLRADQGPLALAVLKKHPYHHTQTLKEPVLPVVLEEKFPAQEFFVVPLVVKDRATGVIVVDNQASGRPLETEPLHVLQMLATQAALVLENAHLYSTIEANNRELLLIRERMLESDRLAALSSLASGMAHEIRNPLVSIGGFAGASPSWWKLTAASGLRGGHPGRGQPAGKTPAGNPGLLRGKPLLLRRSRSGQAHRGHLDPGAAGPGRQQNPGGEGICLPAPAPLR
jgi:transcriptional regulator with GAF, ATPase, and Fis domain